MKDVQDRLRPCGVSVALTVCSVLPCASLKHGKVGGADEHPTVLSWRLCTYACVPVCLCAPRQTCNSLKQF